MPRDLYRVLQVDPGADADVLEAAYRRLARKYHPAVSAAPDAEARMRELDDAYATLRDPYRRAAYDRARAETDKLEPSSERAGAPAGRGRAGGRAGPARGESRHEARGRPH